jgi:hypothetical protein
VAQYGSLADDDTTLIQPHPSRVSVCARVVDLDDVLLAELVW